MTPQQFNEEICKVLGLEPGTIHALTIELRPNSWPQVTVTRFIKLGGIADKIATVVDRVDLTLHPRTHPQMTETFELRPKEPPL